MADRSVEGRRPRTGPVHREVFALLEVTALCGLAVAQPLLDITGRAPDFFLFHRTSRLEIILLVALITVVPPLALWGLGALTGLAGAGVRRLAHLGTVGLLCAALAVQAGKVLLPVRGIPLALLAVTVGASLAALYAYWAPAVTLLRAAATGPLVFVLLFVFASPASPLLFGAPTGSAAAGRPVGPHPPLVVIFFDELPELTLLDDDGRLDARRFPSFARLAADSTWYRNATTAIGATTYAIPSMLTGRYPDREAAPHFSRYPNNLFTLLADQYELRVHESVIQLCPPSDCARARPGNTGLAGLLGDSAALFGQVVSPVDPAEDATAGFTEPTVRGAADQNNPAPTDVKFRWDRRTDNQPLRFREFLSGLRPTAEPTLHFVHVILPHHAFRYLPSGTQYPPVRQLRPDGPVMREFWRQRHVLQTQYTDRLLGMALDAMRASGLYDRATVVVTADHGITFNPDTELRLIEPAQRNAAEIAWVPLFIKAPGQTRARVDDRNWQHVDLLPTLAAYAGVSVPWPVDGVSALGPPRDSADKPFFHKAGDAFALRAERGFATVLAGPDALPYRLPRTATGLIGRSVAGLPGARGTAATVTNLDDFREVDPASGSLPAIVFGTLPASVSTGRQVAIALNGTIGAVAPVSAPMPPKGTRFAGLIADEQLFRPGRNRVEVFLVDPSGTAVTPLSTRGPA